MMTSNSNNSNHQFNGAPILLRHPSSFMIDNNNLMYQQDSAKDYHSPTSPLSPIMDDVPQRLAPEQYQYEFPPKSHLQALSMQLDQSIEDSISFFDASSFTTTTCTTSSTGSSRVSSVVTDDFNAQEDQEFNSFLATLELEQQQQQQQQQHHSQSGFSLSPPPADEESQEQLHLVHDRQLSPLQLPQQAASQMAMMSSATRVREESYDSISTITQPIVAPASFLAHHHRQGNDTAYGYSDDDDVDDNEHQMPMQGQIEWHDTFGTHPSMWQSTFDDPYDSIHPHHRLSEDEDLPVIRRESEMVMTDSDHSMMTDDYDLHSHFSSNSKVVLFKLSKKTRLASPYMPKRNTSGSPSSDEGYDDDLDDDKELPIESASVFLPLDDTPVLDDGLMTTTTRWQQQQQEQIDQLTVQLREEKAMRCAFEKAMEEMAVLMDQQQKMLYDRVEQEVALRQVYERKMDDALMMVKPLEQKLKKETDARCELESMMSHVLGELQEIKAAQQPPPAPVAPAAASRQASARPITTPSSRSTRATKVPAASKTTTTRPSSAVHKPSQEKRPLAVTRPLRSTTPASKSSLTSTKQPVSKSSVTKKQPVPSSKSSRTKLSTATSRPSTAMGRPRPL